MATCVDRTCPKTLSARLGPFGYKMIQTLLKKKSFAQKVVQQANDQKFWYRYPSKAQANMWILCIEYWWSEFLFCRSCNWTSRMWIYDAGHFAGRNHLRDAGISRPDALKGPNFFGSPARSIWQEAYQEPAIYWPGTPSWNADGTQPSSGG